MTNVTIFNSNDTKKFFFIFLQDNLKFEEVGGAGFLELIQHTMDLQHKSSTPLRAKDIMPHPICVCVCVCGCVRACVRACMRVCVYMCFFI